MKQYLRTKVARSASYVEIFISVLILIMILFISFGLAKELFYSIFNSFQIDFDKFLEAAINLIIGVEFVKMIAKHTPESTIEVLLFAIARRLVVDHTGTVDIIIGISAIGLLFVIKKYFYSSNISDPNGYILEPDTTIHELNKIVKTGLSGNENTLKNLVLDELEKSGKKIKEGEHVVVEDVKLKIYSMDKGEIDKIEVVPKTKRFIFF